ncbi:SpoIIE family protein phosphatase [Sorangium sp. So ce429]
MTKKRPAIALMMDYVRSEYQAELRFGAERAAEAHGSNLLVVLGETLAPQGSTATAVNSVYYLVGADTVDGIVVCSTTLCHHVGVEGMRAFCSSYAPLPVCSIGVEVDGTPSLIVDNARGAEMSVGHVAEAHGRRRIAYISGPANNDEAKVRADAYRRVLAQRSIPFDERLFSYGMFTVESGRAAMREILERGVDFDAVVGANDNMTLGAIEELKAHGIDVPRDVLACGFDDVSVARFTSPSLTTVRQPVKRLGALAVETVLRMMRGEAVPARRLLPVELKRRESCGCAPQPAAAPRPSAAPTRGEPLALASQRESLERAMHETLSLATGSLAGWPAALLSGLEAELAGQEGRFLRELEDLLDRAKREGASLEDFQSVITLLRERLGSALEGEGNEALNEELERIWHASRCVIGSASVRAEGEKRLSLELASLYLRSTGRAFSTCLSLPVLREMLASQLPKLQLSRVAVSLYQDPECTTLKSVFVMEDGRAADPPSSSFSARLLAPPGFLFSGERSVMIALPVAFGEAEKFGVAVLDSGANALIYDTLLLQLGSAVEAAALHREVVRQVELRERLEQEKACEESRVAARIQTTLAPARLRLDGLDLSAITKPAAMVGGDYYDVLATSEGGWLGIGDVAGHGLAAGLVMLMIQSMSAALTRRMPTESPSRIVSTLNSAVYHSVRDRLKRDEHATLLLLRYERSGRVTYAGAHEDVLVCRARTRRCERVPSSGLWVGVLPDIRAITRDAELMLEDGDLLVLYSDGVTEARNAHREQFGLERLCSVIEGVQSASPDSIRDGILREVEGWCPSPDDDITIVVARYRAPGG